MEYWVGTGNRGSSFAKGFGGEVLHGWAQIVHPSSHDFAGCSPFMVHRAWFMENGKHKLSQRFHRIYIRKGPKTRLYYWEANCRESPARRRIVELIACCRKGRA